MNISFKNKANISDFNELMKSKFLDFRIYPNFFEYQYSQHNIHNKKIPHKTVYKMVE